MNFYRLFTDICLVHVGNSVLDFCPRFLACHCNLLFFIYRSLFTNIISRIKFFFQKRFVNQEMATFTFSLVYALFLSAMIISNIAGNSLVCLLILKKKAIKTSINLLLFHLAIADLLVAVFFIPPCILSHFIKEPSGVIGDQLCKFVLNGILGWVAAAASSYLLVMIAFERYRATVYPFEKLRDGRSSWFVPLVWIIAILLLLPSLLVTGHDAESQQCVQNFPDYSTARAYKLAWSTCNSVLPICIMGYLYIKIILCLRNHVLVPGCSLSSVSQSRNKVTKMLISVSAIFITCWTPPAVLCVLSPVIPGEYGTVYYVSTVSALLNSSLNPLVYTLHSQQFRKSLVSLVFCRDNKELTIHKTRQTNLSRIKISA